MSRFYKILPVLCMVLILFTACTSPQEETAPAETTASVAEVPTETPAEAGTAEPETTEAVSTGIAGTIEIPGYDTLHFTAGETAQAVYLHNPAQNQCRFVLTLSLESGEVLWTSEPIDPNSAAEELTLSKPLSAGEYPAVLHYDCFSLQENAPLNGADINIIISVE